MAKKEKPLVAKFAVGQYVKSIRLADAPDMLITRVSINQYFRIELYICELPDGTKKEFHRSDLKLSDTPPTN